MTGKPAKKMNVWQLTMLTAANMLGAGIIMLPTKLAQVGTISILSWLVTALGALCLAHVFAQCGMYSRHRGGMGGYAAYRFGLAGYYLTNFSYSISLVVGIVAIAISAVGYIETLMQWNFSPLQGAFATIALLWIAGMANFAGSGWTGKISSVTVWGAILPVAFMSVVGWCWFDFDLYVQAWNPNRLPVFEAASESIVLTLWTFLGFESAAANMESIENPQRDVPRATFMGTLFVAMIYILSTNIMAGIVPNAELLTSNAPFGLAFSSMFNGRIGRVIMTMMVVSCCGALLCWQFTMSQVFKGCGESGAYPRVFAKLNRYGVPVWGMIILLTIQSGFALMTIDTNLFAQFERIVDLAVITNVLPYIICCLSLDKILAKAQVGWSARHRMTVFTMLGILYSCYAVYAAGLRPLFDAFFLLFLGYMLYLKTVDKNRLRRHVID